MSKLLITVKTLFGMEDALAEEMSELGYTEVQKLNRAVQLNGNWEDVYRLNYKCRIAISVLVEIKSFVIHKEDDLYKQAKKIDWSNYFDVDKTFAVKGAIFSTMFRHTQYPLLLVKDAIADNFRDKIGERPDVNIKSPQVMFDVYVKDKNVTISLNTSGLPLYQRGYRQVTGEAPINEVLAAGMLRLSGWDRKSTLIDTMCGSGTIAIEAALWAADIPSMIERTHYAFQNFKTFDKKAWEKVRSEGNSRPIDLGFQIIASDSDARMVNMARRNARVAPIGKMISFEIKDALTVLPPKEKGMLICNPPYGDRIGEEIEMLYQNLGDAFKKNFDGYQCWVISSNMEALKQIGLKPDKKIKLFNGNLECSFRQFKIFEGARKEMLTEREENKIQEEVNNDFRKEPSKNQVEKKLPRETKKSFPKTTRNDNQPLKKGKYSFGTTKNEDDFLEKNEEKTKTVKKSTKIYGKSEENSSNKIKVSSNTPFKAKIDALKKRRK